MTSPPWQLVRVSGVSPRADERLLNRIDFRRDDLSTWALLEWRDLHPTPPLLSVASTLPLQGRVRTARIPDSIFKQPMIVIASEELVGWAKARLRRAHHDARMTVRMVGTLRFAHPTAPRSSQ
jgi:hypothetical protein